MLFVNKPFFQQNFDNNHEIMLHPGLNVYNKESYETGWHLVSDTYRESDKYNWKTYHRYIHTPGIFVYKGEVAENGDLTTLQDYSNTIHYTTVENLFYDKVEVTPFLYVTDVYLNLIDGINNLLYEGTIQDYFNSKTNFIDLTTWMYMFFSSDRSYRDKALYILYTNGLISESDYLTGTAQKNSYYITNFDSSKVISSYNSTTEIRTLEYNKSMVLDSRYDDGQKLYLMVNPMHRMAISGASMKKLTNRYDPNVIGSGSYKDYTNSGRRYSYTYQYREDAMWNRIYSKAYSPQVTFYNPTINKNVEQIPYVAFEITDLNGNGEIKVEQTSIIDLIDNFKVQLKVPRTI